MTKNREVFERDPMTWTIPNDGVAKVGPPETIEEWNVLRYELQSFVAEGEYGAGIERILSSFLANLHRDSQPVAWVSGFFGSGKSHLLKALAALWTDLRFPDGATASGLVNIPTSIGELLKELQTRGVQYGGRYAAAGTLAAGGTSAALSILAIVFAGAGIPQSYAAARLVLWLRREGLYDRVKANVEAAGRTLDEELFNLYVSDRLAKAILEASPGFAASPADVRDSIKRQFPSVDGIPSDEFVDVLAETLKVVGGGQIPLTLIVLDELQQFVGDDPARTLEVQELIEKACSKFGSRLLVVAAGQMALGSSPALQKLQDRFRIEVVLRDSDVDRVVRSVVLRKKQGSEPELRRIVEQSAGEISRQLAGSAIAPNASDAGDLVADYPLLPARRRFWDATLRAMDTAGRATKLRTQLRIVLDATRDVGERDLGVVVPGDAIYDQLRDEYLGTGTLPRDTANLIDDLDDGSAAGPVRSRVAKTAYLIGRLPKEGAKPTGIQATAEMITDLLVADLRTDRKTLAVAVPEAAGALVQRGVLIEVGGEYLLQTPEGAKWASDFEDHRLDLSQDEGWIASQRVSELRAAFEAVLKNVKPVQGEMKESRRATAYFTDNAPKGQEDEVAIWIRTGWEVTDRSVVEAARLAGTSSATVLVFVARQRAEELRASIIDAEAASRAIDRKAPPTTQEGMEARAGLVSRREAARERVRRLSDEIMRGARVFQGGGAEVLEPSANPSVPASLARAVDNAVLRLFPDFADADSKGWARVLDLAKQGNLTPLSAVGHKGEPQEHPVTKAIFASLPAAGRKGQEIRRVYRAAPYGWPQDAIDGALLSLVATGKVEARLNGTVTTPAKIPQNVLGNVEFRPQTVFITIEHRLAVRGIAQELGIKPQSHDDLELPKLILGSLLDLADRAGGDAPLPARPSVERIRDLEAMAGAAQFVGIAEAKDDLLNLKTDWRSAAEDVPRRLGRWNDARRLLEHALGLSLHDQADAELKAVQASRSLLDEPDPLVPTVNALCDALRAAIQERSGEYERVRLAALKSLDASEAWSALAPPERAQILAAERLDGSGPPAVGTISELLRALDELPIKDWQFRIQAVDAQAAKALARAVAVTAEPPTELPHAATVIRTNADLEQYIGRIRASIEPLLAEGKTVIV